MLSRAHRHLRIEQGDILLMHVIDDVNTVGRGVPGSTLLELQREVWQQLDEAGLPSKLSKSTSCGELRRNKLPFIGFV